MKRALLLLAGLLLCTLAQAETVYRWVDEQGNIHFGDEPPSHQSATRKDYAPLPMVGTPAYRYTPSTTGKAPAKPKQRNGKKVLMYSAAWCGVCKKARAYMRQEQIPFTEYDIETTDKGKRDYKRLNGKGVPIIMVGKQRMNGFSAGRLERMLAN